MLAVTPTPLPLETQTFALPDLPPADRLKTLNAFFRLTQNPANFEAIYDIDEVLRQTHLSQTSIDYLKTQPGMSEILQERYLGPTPDLHQLITYPSDSLGYHFAAHLIRHNFDPQFYRDRPVTDDITYISLRRSQTHDIHHIITGFSTDLPGEIGLQAFQLAQLRSPLAIALLFSALINTLPDPIALTATMQAIHQGWTMGLQAKPCFAQKWEEHWEKPLSTWRAELNIQPATAIA